MRRTVISECVVVLDGMDGYIHVWSRRLRSVPHHLVEGDQLRRLTESEVSHFLCKIRRISVCKTQYLSLRLHKHVSQFYIGKTMGPDIFKPKTIS